MDGQAGRIVVGYDGSEPARDAVDWAATEAGRSGRPLTVLHVIDRWSLLPVPVGPVLSSDLPAGETDRIAREGADRARRLAGPVDVQARTSTGRVASTLIRAARDADLLVVGTRGHGDLTGILLGSVAVTVSAQAHSPVVVVRGDSTQSPGAACPVVVGFDGSAGSEAAVRLAADTAARTRAPLVAVTVYRPQVGPDQPITDQDQDGSEQDEPDQDGTGCDFGPEAAFPPGLRADPLRTARLLSAAAVELARTLHPQLDVQARVVMGTTVGQLCTSAHRAGLLVVGSRGVGDLAGLLLGSVSRGVLHSAPCPVAVVGVPARGHDHSPPRNTTRSSATS